jgi:hypothetical protein
MEQLKANILNLVSGEHESVYSIAKQMLLGIESEEKTTESKIASLLFNAVIAYAEARKTSDEELRKMINTAKNERKRIQDCGFIDLGWINPSQYEKSVYEMQKVEREIYSLAHLCDVSAKEVATFKAIICSRIDFN